MCVRVKKYKFLFRAKIRNVLELITENLFRNIGLSVKLPVLL